MNKNLGEALRKVREQRKMSREALAKKAKISDIYVAHLENNNPAARLSINLYDKLKGILNFGNEIAPLADRHNAIVKKYRSGRKSAA